MTQRWIRGTGMALVVVMLAACATPMASRPIVMQGPGFDVAAYDVALSDCRQMVLRQTNYQQADDAATRAVGGALIGAALGAALGAAMGNAGYGATIGTVGGAAGGLGTYGEATAERQRVFNAALAQCLSLKGYQVLGVGQ
jgi:outer membrane lipoprotein SlyB